MFGFLLLEQAARSAGVVTGGWNALPWLHLPQSHGISIDLRTVHCGKEVGSGFTGPSLARFGPPTPRDPRILRK